MKSFEESQFFKVLEIAILVAINLTFTALYILCVGPDLVDVEQSTSYNPDDAWISLGIYCVYVLVLIVEGYIHTQLAMERYYSDLKKRNNCKCNPAYKNCRIIERERDHQITRIQKQVQTRIIVSLLLTTVLLVILTMWTIKPNTTNLLLDTIYTDKYVVIYPLTLMVGFLIPCDGGIRLFSLFMNHKIHTKRSNIENNRFQIVLSQDSDNKTEIWVDNDTGVSYLYHTNGCFDGLTPLLDKDGKPIITQPKI